MKIVNLIFMLIFLLEVLLINGCTKEVEEKPLEELYLYLNLRSRVETPEGSNIWEEVITQKEFQASETAIIIIDMWDKHWCKAAMDRLEKLAPVMNSVIEGVRKNGVQIIHSPCETIGFYDNTPYRKKIIDAHYFAMPKKIDLFDKLPPMPIQISPTGDGCATGEKFKAGWSRQHPSIMIAGGDVISEDIQELYNFLQQQGIKNILVMGVYTNMCVLNRPVGIKQLIRLGFNVVLVRDMTDAMYDPTMPPYVSNAEATELVVKHIEKYLVPSVLSEDLLHVKNRHKYVRDNIF